MTNQEAFEAARAGDWIAESFIRDGDVFKILGTSTGYSSFADCLDNGQSIFYAAFDADDNREAGLAVWDADAKTLTPVEIHATLTGGSFIKGDPEPLLFERGGTITGTFNATAFNAMWTHVWNKGNPHETEAKDIEQDNENSLGDTVQDALDKVAALILTGDIEGGIDIDLGDLEGVENIVLQNRTEAQKVVSDLSFEKEGDNPLTMKDTGMYAGAEYVRNKSNVWEVDPSLSVTNDISAGGNLSVEGTSELKGDVSVNGNITIEGGGQIIDPDGKPVGGSGAGMVISETEPTDKVEGMQWLNPTAGLVLFWDGEKWLQMPGGKDGADGADGTDGIDGSLYDDSWIQPALDLKADKSDLNAKANVGDSYTKAESDSAFQVKGDYIDDAPEDGEMYVRKNGAWELFTPSGGGGGGGMYEPIAQPTQFGPWSGIGEVEKWGTGGATEGVTTFNVPAGYVFVLRNIILQGSAQLFPKTIYIDGIQMWPGVTDSRQANGEGTKVLSNESAYIVRNSLQLDARKNGASSIIMHIDGTFIPADSTRESAALREEYMAKEAEMIAAMPVTQETPE